MGLGRETNETEKQGVSSSTNQTTPRHTRGGRQIERNKKDVHPSSKHSPSDVDAMMVAEKKVSAMHPTVLGCQTTAQREGDTKRRALDIHVRGESGPQNLTCATCDVRRPLCALPSVRDPSMCLQCRMSAVHG